MSRKLVFGMALAGKTVQLRFRIGSDQAAGEFGWEIDNIAFSGIDNKPFATIIDDKDCNPVVVTDAGMTTDGAVTAMPGRDGGPDGGSFNPPLADSSCNCAVAQRRNGSGRLAIILALGLLPALVIRRRRLAAH